MVDFHGATKPTGMEWIWPNVMGYDAVLGMEQSKWGMRDNPDHRLRAYSQAGWTIRPEGSRMSRAISSSAATPSPW
jgi:hypothetical protein